MKTAIQNYYKRVRTYSHNYFDVVKKSLTLADKDIAKKLRGGYYPVKRKKRTNTKPFKDKYGYSLPEEIDNYINIFYHVYIFGYCNSWDCIVLFNVFPYEGADDDSILFQKYGLMDLAASWVDIDKGNIEKFVPIGWLYDGTSVLYEVKTGNIYLEDFDNDGIAEEKPIAKSLKDLIMSLDLTGTIGRRGYKPE